MLIGSPSHPVHSHSFGLRARFSFLEFADDLLIPNGGVLDTEGVSTSHVFGNLTLLPGATTQVVIGPGGVGNSRIQVDGHVVLDGGNLQLSLGGL